MVRAVFDASVVISACGWGADSYRCLIMVARRRVRSFAAELIITEWRETLAELEKEGTLFRRDPWPTLEWLIEMSQIAAPAPLGKRRSRDAGDDPYLACALAVRAEFIISRDNDLLALGKPFGVAVVTPRAFLSLLQRAH